MSCFDQVKITHIKMKRIVKKATNDSNENIGYKSIFVREIIFGHLSKSYKGRMLEKNDKCFINLSYFLLSLVIKKIISI